MTEQTRNLNALIRHQRNCAWLIEAPQRMNAFVPSGAVQDHFIDETTQKRFALRLGEKVFPGP